MNCPAGAMRQFGPCKERGGVVLQRRANETHVVAVGLDVRVTIRRSVTVLTFVHNEAMPGKAGKGYSECLVHFEDDQGWFPTYVEASQFEDSSKIVTRSVETIDGIGPTYAERLYDADIETVADLVDHSPASLAAASDAPCSRTESWLARADSGTTRQLDELRAVRTQESEGGW